MNNEISDNTVITNHTAATTYGIYLLQNANNTLLARNNVTGNVSYYIQRSSNNLIRDCIDTHSSLADVFIQLDVSPPSVNNTFLNCSYAKELVAGAGNYLTRQWYLDVLVNDSLGNLEDATVEGFNVSDDLLFEENTSAQGTIDMKIITEYINMTGTMTYSTPHIFNVSKLLYLTNTTEYNISQTENVYHFVSLYLDTAPTIDIVSPEEMIYNGSTILINITAEDPSGIDSIWYGWNGTNATYSEPVNTTFNKGANTLHVWTNDTAGNVNYTNVTFIVNSCTPPISGDWYINCSDACVWDAPVIFEIPGNVTLNETGVVTLKTTWNFTSSDQFIFQHSGCEFRIGAGGELSG
jgi:hypothetical protein